MLPLTASAQTLIDGIYYDLDSDSKEATVKSGGYSSNITIPTTVTYNDVTYRVTSIGESAFYRRSSLTSVTIPNSVTSIGSEAFNKCSGLKEMAIPNSVTTIESSTFYGCSSLTDVYCYAENVPTTSSDAFNQSNITSATLYVSKTTMENYKSTEPWSGFGSIVALDEPVAEDIAINEKNFPDDNFRNWILSQDYGQDGILTSDELSNITLLSIPEMKINDLTGIEYFTALTYLGCFGNNLTTLDLTKNIALISLSCANNQLTSLDVSKNTLLTNLNCNGNQMTSLDVSECTALTELSCKSNRINSLNVSGCVALKTLFCEENQLASLDVSKNIALESLSCGSNQLTSLDVSKNTALNGLYRSSNQLTSLDVSKSTSLTSLKCHRNQLTSINIFGCTSLTTIFCYQNQIKGKMMDTFIDNLPNVKRSSLRIIYNEDEGNIISTTQVASAREKGWDPQCYAQSDYGPNYTWKSYSGSELEPLRGDVNNDGLINGTDIQAVINLIVEGEYDAKADVNDDNIVNGTDIQEVINIIVGGE